MAKLSQIPTIQDIIEYSINPELVNEEISTKKDLITNASYTSGGGGGGGGGK